jgi:4-carboxymuconolactone decarboxylase
MSRLPPLDPADAEPETARVLAAVPPLGIFRTVAHAQGAFPAWMRFGGKLFDPAELDPLVRELAILQVAAMTPGADYEWVQHVPIALGAGATEAQVAAIEAGDVDAEALGADGRLVVRLTAQVVRDAQPDDATYAAAAARFTPRELVHLLLVIGQYMMLARIMATARIDLDPALGDEVAAHAERALKRRP